MAEYAYNNSLHSTVKMTPLFTNYGYHPQPNWPTGESSQNPTSQNYFQWMTSVHRLCHQGLGIASEIMTKYHDRKAKPAPVYQPGNLVMLNGKNLKTRRPTRRLDTKLHGSFKVMKVMSPTALQRELPSQWRIHNAFHVSLIEPFRIASYPIRDPSDLDAMVTEKHELGYDVKGYKYQTGYEVEEIMGSQFNKERKWVLYLVKWKGYPKETDWTEEPYENFDDKKLLREFYRRNPQAAKDKRL